VQEIGVRREFPLVWIEVALERSVQLDQRQVFVKRQLMAVPVQRTGVFAEVRLRIEHDVAQLDLQHCV
jgi:hypothetical protein